MSATTSPDPGAGALASVHEILAGKLGDLPPAADCVDVPLRQMGLDSATFVAFLVAIEEKLGFVWSDEVPRESLATLGTIAALVASTVGSSS